VFDRIQYSWPVTAGLMWAAAKNGGRLSVLDFGGALGSSYFQHRKFLAELDDVSWSVVEQEHFVQAGREHIQDDRLSFYETIDLCVKVCKPNVILLSSSIQYLGEPYSIIDDLIATGANAFLFDRTPFGDFEKDKILVQHVPDEVYTASYPIRVFSESSLFPFVNNRLYLVESFVSPEGNIDTIYGGFSFKGLIFSSNFV